MTACEKCWADAFVRAQTLGGSQADHYRRLLTERDSTHSRDADREPSKSDHIGRTERCE